MKLASILVLTPDCVAFPFALFQLQDVQMLPASFRAMENAPRPETSRVSKRPRTCTSRPASLEPSFRARCLPRLAMMALCQGWAP